MELRYGTAAGRWVITATVLGSGMAQLDATVVGIALPAIGRQFNAGVTTLQWVVTAYTLTLAGLLLLGGALGDRLGRRRIFVIGAIWFAVASLAAGLAPDGSTLIAARALQGVGAALLTPGSLAIIQASFFSEDRSRAIGAWSGLGGVAAALGPFLGGWLIAAVSWRLIFFINLPIAVAVVLIAVRRVPELRDPTIRGGLDVPGAVLITLGLIGLIYGLIEGPDLGWASPATIVALVGGAACLVAFGLVEHRAAHPIMPLALFRSTQFSAANAVTFAVYGGLGGALFLVPLTLQEVKGYSPLEAGAALLPVTGLMLLLSARSGALAARRGPRVADVGGAGHRRRRAGAAVPGNRNRQLRDRCPAGRVCLRLRPGVHGGPADGHGAGCRAARAHRGGVRHQQRRGPGRLPGSRGPAARHSRHHG